MKLFEFAGITGKGKTLREAKEDCERQIKNLLRTPKVISPFPAYLVTPQDNGGWFYSRYVEGKDIGGACSCTDYRTDVAFMLYRCSGLFEESKGDPSYANG